MGSILDLAVIAVAILVSITLGLLAWTLGVSTTRALRRLRRDILLARLERPWPSAGCAADRRRPRSGPGGGLLRGRRMTEQRPSGYRGALPTRNDTIARPWVLAVVAIFVLMFVLAFLASRSARFPSRRDRRIRASLSPSTSAAPSASEGGSGFGGGIGFGRGIDLRHRTGLGGRIGLAD